MVQVLSLISVGLGLFAITGAIIGFFVAEWSGSVTKYWEIIVGLLVVWLIGVFQLFSLFTGYSKNLDLIGSCVFLILAILLVWGLFSQGFNKHLSSGRGLKIPVIWVLGTCLFTVVVGGLGTHYYIQHEVNQFEQKLNQEIDKANQELNK
ncbi:hypothetical protein HC026_01665 [Lactobacillus sp. LC28-10]|uniref:DUF4064 domain-containing protein n=1 Tax=Secundilactobacillus angelensis TaxID=2722706 RepID=A0ABX1KUL4_9LACO|nr:hypothetical protein [Secundilactobacillus angelensis]MCH5461182.1 hypothetical protein [Secundilactobacillus angelensis]NLR17622.1 hypothetical protein [Secundilactobacillus angelensis]